MSKLSGDSRVSIVVSTYNERENVQRRLNGIRGALAGQWPYEVIIVDENSPDGTAGAVRQAAKTDPAATLVLRPKKLGLGSAVVAGFRVAPGSRWVIMDADLSHRPQDIPGLLDGLHDADIVIGSRYVTGGGVVGWPLHRVAISRVRRDPARGHRAASARPWRLGDSSCCLRFWPSLAVPPFGKCLSYSSNGKKGIRSSPVLECSLS